MRDITQFSELEAELVNRLIHAYPAGLGYDVDHDREVRELAAELIDEGRVERRAIAEQGVDGAWYRLTDRYADEIRQTAAERASRASEN